MTFPLNAPEIFVEWVTREGGIGVSAFTDEKGLPFLGLSPLNRMGTPNGLPCWFRRSRLMSDIAVGFRAKHPIVINIDVEVTGRGLKVVLCLPTDIAPAGYYERHLFSPWGSDPPRYGFTVIPSNSNWPINPFPWGDDADLNILVHGD